MQRVYEEVIKEHLSQNRQMVFLMGPRQVGKTTISLSNFPKSDLSYFNWDNADHRLMILEGPARIAKEARLEKLRETPYLIVFDEIHKFEHWKVFLKGFFDTYGDKTKIIVTGSAKLDIFNSGGESLMGRYFSYRIHPLSVRELIDSSISKKELKNPEELPNDQWEALLNFGGFPEAFLKRNKIFYQRWKNLRKKQLFQEDINDLTNIQEIKQMEVLAELLRLQAGQLTNYSNLAIKVGVALDTIKRWLSVLKALYFCFSIQPWSKNISRSLLKEPKIYLWDWSLIDNPGVRLENFVASHLLKATQFWTDYGLGEYDLFFLRDKDKREVDFLVTKNNEPWFLVEVKNSVKEISKSLYYFQKQTGALHAFQVSHEDSFVKKDCFSFNKPIIVPLKTLLSQLV